MCPSICADGMSLGPRAHFQAVSMVERTRGKKGYSPVAMGMVSAQGGFQWGFPNVGIFNPCPLETALLSATPTSPLEAC